MIRQEVLQKLDIKTQENIYKAMLDELTERRKVQDPALFAHCFVQEAPEEGQGYLDWINDFSEIAGEAFTEYHKLRAQGAYLDENGNVVVGSADQAGDGGDVPLDPEDPGEEESEA